eukprot:4353627-Alexandrium_andersonii.AAC.1
MDATRQAHVEPQAQCKHWAHDVVRTRPNSEKVNAIPQTAGSSPTPAHHATLGESNIDHAQHTSAQACYSYGPRFSDRHSVAQLVQHP